MSKYSFLNLVKLQAKSVQRITDVSRAKALNLVATQHGFSNYHEMQTVAKRNPYDKRLMKAALGTTDLEEVVYDENIVAHIEDAMESHLSSEIASTNAYDYTVENLEVLDAAYVETKGDLFIEVEFEFVGDQDPDRLYTGRLFYIRATIMLLRRDDKWIPLDAFNGVEVHEFESDFDREHRLELESSQPLKHVEREA